MPRYNPDDNTYDHHPRCPVNEDDQAERLAQADAEWLSDRDL